MGTTYSVRYVTDEAPSLAEKTDLLEEVEHILDEVNRSMSTYLEESEISRLNRAPAGEPFTASEDLFAVVLEADRLSRLTDGAFDATVGPLVNAYGFGPNEPGAIPTPTELEALRERTGFELLEIDPVAATLTKARDDLFLDLSAVAKGFAVDRIAAALSERGFVDFMVEVGGEVRASGRNLDADPWRVGIERPEFVLELSGRPLQRIAALDGLSMATSGDYRNFREVDGRRFTHIVDPRTGLSVEHRLASVSVVHERCLVADGLATALMVLGPADALDFAEEHDVATLLLIRSDAPDGGEMFEERMSTAWSALLGS